MSGGRWFTQLGAANGGYFLPPLSAADLTDLCQIRDHSGWREGGHLVNRRRAAAGAGKGKGAAHLLGFGQEEENNEEEQMSGQKEEEEEQTRAWVRRKKEKEEKERARG